MCRDLVLHSLKDNQGVLIHGKFWECPLNSNMSRLYDWIQFAGSRNKHYHHPHPPHHYSRHHHGYHHLSRVTLHRHYCHQLLNLSQTFPSVHCEPVFGDVSDSKDLKNRIPAFPPVGLFYHLFSHFDLYCKVFKEERKKEGRA